MTSVKLIPGGNKPKKAPRRFPGPRQEQFLLVGKFSHETPAQPAEPARAGNINELIGEIFPPEVYCTLEDEAGNPRETPIPIHRYSDLSLSRIQENCELLQRQRWQLEAIDKLKCALHKNPKFRRVMANCTENPEQRQQLIANLRLIESFFQEHKEKTIYLE